MRVSVPLRGYFFEIEMNELVDMITELFPSPYGDIFLKCVTVNGAAVWVDWFPSPYGDIFLKYYSREDDSLVGDEKRFRPLTGIFF